MRLTLTHSGDVLAARIMRGRAARALNAAPVLAEIGAELRGIESAVFASGGRRGGGSWKKLAESTLRRRRRAGINSQRTLIARRKLISSVTKTDDPNQVFEVSESELRFGSRLPYARRQQRGGGHVPARPFLRVTKYDERRFDKLIAEWVARG